MVLGKLSRSERYKELEGAAEPIEKKILWNIGRVLVKAGKGMTVEINLARHYPHT